MTYNGSNCDQKSQLSRILTELLNPRASLHRGWGSNYAYSPFNLFRDEGEKDEEEDNDDVYEDEEAELSEEEEENDEETQVENISVFSRLYSWVIGLLGLCNKKN